MSDRRLSPEEKEHRRVNREEREQARIQRQWTKDQFGGGQKPLFQPREGGDSAQPVSDGADLEELAEPREGGEETQPLSEGSDDELGSLFDERE